MVILRGIASERGYAFTHPYERRVLIKQGVVAGGVISSFFGQLGMRHESENAETIVHCHRDNALRGYALSVVSRL